MKSFWMIIALLVIAVPLQANPIPYTSEAAFLQYLESPYLIENFDTMRYGSYKAPTMRLNQSGYQVVLSAYSRLYSLPGSMSTNSSYDVLKIDFTESPNPVTAVGGYFWPTDLPGNNLTGPIRIVFSDGSEYVAENAAYGDFLGFTITDGTAFQFLEISTLVRSSWPTVDHLYVGNDPPIATPEPSSLLFLGTGIGGIGMLVLRKKL
jgi:hypothetical protein